MILRFYAAPGHLCNYPGPKRIGQLYHYVGRTARPQPKGVVHEANPEPAELDTDNDEQRRYADRFAKFVRQGGLFAADSATAKHCGVRFVPLARDAKSGEWGPAPRKPQSAQKRGKRDLDGASADHGAT